MLKFSPAVPPYELRFSSFLLKTFLKLNFCFEIIVNGHEVVRSNTERSHVLFTRFPPKVTSCENIARYYNQNIYIHSIKIQNSSLEIWFLDIDQVKRLKFLRAYCVCVLYAFIHLIRIIGCFWDEAKWKSQVQGLSDITVLILSTSLLLLEKNRQNFILASHGIELHRTYNWEYPCICFHQGAFPCAACRATDLGRFKTCPGPGRPARQPFSQDGICSVCLLDPSYLFTFYTVRASFSDW